MKYLGLILDSRWAFKPYFELLAARLGCAVQNFDRILPNLGGTCEGVCRLYMGVVRFIALYGAPVWCGPLVASTGSIELMHRKQRRMAIRMARAYRTVSREVACMLVGLVPWVYMARFLEEIDWKEERARGGKPATRKSMEERRNRAKRDNLRHWQERFLHAKIIEGGFRAEMYNAKARRPGSRMRSHRYVTRPCLAVKRCLAETKKWCTSGHRRLRP
ncbi:uncharacterized protein LOC105198159 [Solenopsis invicta]|uniref:uncharacterized protein LOC105198159 n=1 Tax=Solenopsis invicta TaxID=13686 RepID=UPI0005960493|nr:uncharacterized protein LOC105198159 [Solenopsis invicta]